MKKRGHDRKVTKEQNKHEKYVGQKHHKMDQ